MLSGPRYDFSIELQYVQMPDKPEGHKTAVLAIQPRYRKGHRYLFNLDHAYIVREPRLMFQCAMEICETLYDMVDEKRMAHIAMALDNYIDDLVKSKPVEPGEKVSIGEGKMDIGGVNHHFELTKEKGN